MTRLHCIECAALVRSEAAFCHKCGASSENAIRSSEDTHGTRVRRLTIAMAATLMTSLVIGLVPWGTMGHIAELVGMLGLAAFTGVLLIQSWSEVRPFLLAIPLQLGALTTLIGTTLTFAWMVPILALLEYLGAVMLDGNMEGWPLGVSLLMIAVVVPIEEELLFRGVVQNDMERLVGGKTAWVLQAFAFATMHLAPVAFFTHFVLGLIFGAMRNKSKSLYPSMIAHAAWNLFVCLS